MRAVALSSSQGTLGLIDVPRPTIKRPEQVILRVLEVGVCGTDRELARGNTGAPPPGHEHLIIGHEMLAEVVEVGTAVAAFKPGDLVVDMVRRGCTHCPSCLSGNADFCTSGDYIEHGIKQLDGFMTEYVLADANFLIPVHPDLRAVGVLMEPLSVCEKALAQAHTALSRFPCPPINVSLSRADPGWAKGLRALVAGSGPIGMLGAMILLAHGAEVIVVDRSEEDTPSSRLLQRIGARHINGADVQTEHLDDLLGPINLIFEATGAPGFSFRLIDALGRNGVYVMTGIPHEACTPLPAGTLMHDIVLYNQTILGSVNASKADFEQGASDLLRFRELWGDAINAVITLRVPLAEFMQAIEPAQPGIKAVVEIQR